MENLYKFIKGAWTPDNLKEGTIIHHSGYFEPVSNVPVENIVEPNWEAELKEIQDLGSENKINIALTKTLELIRGFYGREDEDFSVRLTMAIWKQAIQAKQYLQSL